MFLKGSRVGLSTRSILHARLSLNLARSTLVAYTHTSGTIGKHSAMSVADITSKLRALNLTHGAFVSHAPTTSPASWKEELTKAANVPTSYQLVKTLVFKPKTA